jgi:hypothetical protein
MILCARTAALVAVMAPAKRTIPVLALGIGTRSLARHRGGRARGPPHAVRLRPRVAPGARHDRSQLADDAEAVAVRYDSGTMTPERATR